jgi:hypothetical protein
VRRNATSPLRVLNLFGTIHVRSLAIWETARQQSSWRNDRQTATDKSSPLHTTSHTEKYLTDVSKQSIGPYFRIQASWPLANLSVSSSGSELTPEQGTDGFFSETSVRTYNYFLRNNAEERNFSSASRWKPAIKHQRAFLLQSLMIWRKIWNKQQDVNLKTPKYRYGINFA